MRHEPRLGNWSDHGDGRGLVQTAVVYVCQSRKCGQILQYRIQREPERAVQERLL
ncbi:MAG: hypothetical protein Q8R28_18835 [Dehalococcoidia bacterium]|nr:hypothetical protein [Dehalococcoidia bacterium]